MLRVMPGGCDRQGQGQRVRADRKDNSHPTQPTYPRELERGPLFSHLPRKRRAFRLRPAP